MTKTLSDIKSYWKSAAETETDSAGLRPTARDPYLQAVVESAVLKWLPGSGTALDIGCGDGLSTLRFAKQVTKILGVDYIPEFVDRAAGNLAKSEIDNASFEMGDILDLDKTVGTYGAFDYVVTIRCLINLSSWEFQEKALHQIAKAVKPGGLFLASEGWLQGWDELNACRRRMGLEAMSLVEFNTLIDKYDFENAVGEYFDVIDVVNFGFYIYMSRVFQPAYVSPEEPSHLHKINEVSAGVLMRDPVGMAQVFRECDYASLYVLRRKA